MKIGELIIDVGIKGDDKVRNVVVGVKGGLSDMASSGLAAKAAIVGAVYALEKLMQQSMHAGQSILNFNALTNISGKTLQQWEYGFRQAGASAQEAEENFKSIQAAMGQMALNKGAPEGSSLMSSIVGGLDFQRMKTDMPYLMEKAREFAKLTAGKPNVAAYNQILHGMGFSDNFIAAARRGLLDQSVLNKAPTYSNSQAQELAKIDRAWTNLGIKMSKRVGDLNAKHGLKIVEDLSLLADVLGDIIEKLDTLATKLHAFDALSGSFHEIYEIFNAFNVGGDSKKKKKSYAENWAHDALAPARAAIKNVFSPGATTNLNQVNHFHGVKGAAEAGLLLGRATRDALPKRNQTK